MDSSNSSGYSNSEVDAKRVKGLRSGPYRKAPYAQVSSRT